MKRKRTKFPKDKPIKNRTKTKTRTGVLFSILQTRKHNHRGERLYKIQFPIQTSNDGYTMPGIVGTSLFSRKQIEQTGAVLES